jgi:hypothetical protein
MTELSSCSVSPGRVNVETALRSQKDAALGVDRCHQESQEKVDDPGA